MLVAYEFLCRNCGEGFDNLIGDRSCPVCGFPSQFVTSFSI